MKFFIMLIVSSIFMTGSVFACGCEAWGTASQMMKDHKGEVFLAIPSSDSVKVGTYSEEGDVLRTRFNVIRSYKNKNLKNVSIKTISEETNSCGLTYKKDGGAFLIFAWKENGSYVTSGCEQSDIDYPEMRKFLRDLNRI